MRLIGLALAAVPLSACTVSTAQKHAAASPMVAPVPQNVGSNIPATSEFMRAFVDADKLYLEVPTSMLRKDFLLYQENQRKQQILRWHRRGNKLLLVKPYVAYVVDSATASEQISRRGRIAPILAAFPVESERPGGSVIIDVTQLFTTKIEGFLGASSHTDAIRSFVERVEVYPDNIEIEAVHTRAEPATKYWEYPTSRIHWSVVRMPTDLMRPRLFDPRIGFWMETYYDDGADYTANTRGSITRWRLEKRDSSAAVSEPVKPIVFYIDPLTPAKWRPYIRQGIEAWQPAFEAAGFKNAIIAKSPPADPNWSVDDFRNSVVRWYGRVPRDKRPGGGTAVPVIDQRTGEILRANVYISESHEFFLLNWYFTMAAPLDVRAWKLPLTDSLMGSLYQYYVTHEIGHALGLRDGSYGKLVNPTDSLRSATFLRTTPFTPSVMNYARFNYAAQPEDSIPPPLLRQRVGPADVYSIMWGYKPIPSANTVEEERPTLDAWARMQDTSPGLRWVPSELSEAYSAYNAVDDSDPVRSTALGIQNLKRVMRLLPSATISPGTDNALLRQLYFATLEQWQNEMKRVVALIGGFTVQPKSGSQSGPVFAPFPAAQQRAAVAFLDSMAFRVPEWLVVPEITRRFERTGAARRVMAMQAHILSSMLGLQRLNWLTELETVARQANRQPAATESHGANSARDVYTTAELLSDVRKGLWAELSQPKVTIDRYRQSLQEAYLVVIRSHLSMPPQLTFAPISAEVPMPATIQLSAYERALVRSELHTLQGQLDQAIPKAADGATRAHLELMRQLVGHLQTLEPKELVQASTIARP